MNPILIKSEQRNDHNRPLTWQTFLKLREVAKQVAEAEQGDVYLVGSVLSKEIPRDVDLSIVLPLDEFERRYGMLPTRQEDFDEYMKKANSTVHKHWAKLMFAQMVEGHYGVYIDLKVCPDTWWTDKDKLLLSSPNDIEKAKQDEFKTFIEGEVKEHTNIANVIDTIENDTAFEVDAQALQYDLEHMESGETIRLRDDCAIYKY